MNGIQVNAISKEFVLHNQGGVQLSVLRDADLSVQPGECVALTGPSGAGKSTLMRMVYGNYLCNTGSIHINGHHLDSSDPHAIIEIRRRLMGYVSQFLKVLPRVPTIEVVMEPALDAGESVEVAETRAKELLTRLNIPEKLWTLSPLTFSGGEQQRVNIARGFVHAYPVLLLDEPTASLDPVNRCVVLSLIEEAKVSGVAVLGIFHDAEARAQVCDREVEVNSVKIAR